jgi:hypothetical protein
VRGANPGNDRAVELAADAYAAGNTHDVRRRDGVERRVGVHAQHPVVADVGSGFRADEDDFCSGKPGEDRGRAERVERGEVVEQGDGDLHGSSSRVVGHAARRKRSR